MYNRGLLHVCLVKCTTKMECKVKFYDKIFDSILVAFNKLTQVHGSQAFCWAQVIWWHKTKKWDLSSDPVNIWQWE